MLVLKPLLVIIDHVLREGRPYADPGADYFEQPGAQRLGQIDVRRLNALGNSFTLTPLPPTEPVPA